MKTMIIGTLIAAASSMASPVNTIGSVLYSIKSVDMPNVVGRHGQVNIDLEANTIGIHIDQQRTCPPGRMCTMEYRTMLNLTAELPIISIKQDGCGVVTYTAQKDQRPVDGAFKKITVKDYSQVICDYLVESPISLTYQSAIYNRMTGEENRASFTAKGSHLLQGGVSFVSKLHDKTCSLDRQIMDYSLVVDTYNLKVQTLLGDRIDLGFFADVSEYGLPGVMFRDTYRVNKEVSDLPGAGTTYRDSLGTFSLQLPVVAPQPHGFVATLTLLKDGPNATTNQLLCQNLR